MKNTAFLLLFLLGALTLTAQNWQPLQPGEQPWFTNGFGYLRGMRIDSVGTEGANTVYYPYHTPRALNGYAELGYMLDSTGGSWLGKRVLATPGGDWLFDNLWDDTILIKTAAVAGDSWSFYNDTSAYSYTATLVSVDTATVLGTMDSVKKIVIEADSAGALYETDSVQGWTVVWSKSHGFVEVMDLYTFPYHDTGGRWHKRLDLFVDMMHGKLGAGDLDPDFIYGIDSSILNFRRVPFHNPTQMELFDFEVGDVFERSSGGSTEYWATSTSGSYSLSIDSIVSKTQTPTSVSYTTQGQYSSHTYSNGMGIPPSNSYYNTPTAGTITAGNALLWNLETLPEETGSQTSYYTFLINPTADTGPCGYNYYTAHAVSVQAPYLASGYFEQVDDYTSYGTGLGELGGAHKFYLFGNGVQSSSSSTIFALKSGDTCFGSLIPANLAVSMPAASRKAGFRLSPNPTTDHLLIQAGGPVKALRATVTDMAGRALLQTDLAATAGCVSTSSLADGPYLCTITFADGSRASLPFVVRH